MFNKLLFAVAVMLATMGIATAQVDVNKADQAALDGIRGVGPKMSKAILDERKKGGEFRDWADLEGRVKGVGEKSAGRLSAAGLTVNGQTRSDSAGSAKESRKARVNVKQGDTPANDSATSAKKEM